MFWNRTPKTTGAEHEAAVARTSEDWASEIARLSDELTSIDVMRAQLIAEGGRAELDGQAALTADIAAKLHQLDTRERIVRSAIEAARDRQADAETDEARKRLTLKLRTYLGHVAVWAEATAGVKDAEAALTLAQRAKRDAVAGLGIVDLYGDLLGSGVTVVAVDDLLPLGGDNLRAEAERLRTMAASASVGGPEGETIGVLPLTPKQIETAAINAAQPEMERRRALGVLGAQIHDAQAHASRLASDRTAHQRDRQVAAERVADLEHQAEALTERVEVIA